MIVGCDQTNVFQLFYVVLMFFHVIRFKFVAEFMLLPIEKNI
jgi:hypothetical protein